MITEFGGFKIGDRVKHIKDDAIGTVVLFDSEWLKENPNAEVFDVGVAWDNDYVLGLPSKIEIDWQFSNRLELTDEKSA